MVTVINAMNKRQLANIANIYLTAIIWYITCYRIID